MLGWFVVGLLAAALVGLLVWTALRRARQAGRCALCEYWMYSPSPKTPHPQAALDHMVAKNPHNRPGSPCIGTREGTLFTDIRLRTSLVLRAKNPAEFRPDLFSEAVQLDAECLARLSEAHGFVRAMYASGRPLPDDRHLRFMPHLAGALCRLTQGSLVFDTVCERFWTSEAWARELGEGSGAERFDLHVRLVELRTAEGLRLETRGLRKVGSAELRLEPASEDLATVCTHLLRSLAEAVFHGDRQNQVELEAFGDSYVLQLMPRGGYLQVTLSKRVQL